ncbi:MAG: nucleotidyltransferase domain-containing protein [Epsilonproteobacteria bacterium]|nr:nucleotidyltransferase domain-containing protein [Campylobacterota bacterium]
MIALEPKHLKIIQDILAPYPYNFYAYGSRVKGTHKKFSDLDLCFKENISDKELTAIETALEESDLPFTVDLINFNTCSKNFRKLIEADLILISADKK